jgi:hypothetical protein
MSTSAGVHRNLRSRTGSACVPRPSARITAWATAAAIAAAGSQRAAAPGDARPRPATEAAGEPHAGRRPATQGDGRSVHGIQEARGPSPHSSTFPQLRGYLWLSYLIFDFLQCSKKSRYLTS